MPLLENNITPLIEEEDIVIVKEEVKVNGEQ